MLTEGDSDDIERIQKVVLKVILTHNYTDYSTACNNLNLQTLKTRQTNLCLKFALKCLESDKFCSLFVSNKVKNVYKLRDADKFDVPLASTSRYKNSPRIYLTNLFNDFFRNKKK